MRVVCKNYLQEQPFIRIRTPGCVFMCTCPRQGKNSDLNWFKCECVVQCLRVTVAMCSLFMGVRIVSSLELRVPILMWNVCSCDQVLKSCRTVVAAYEWFFYFWWG